MEKPAEARRGRFIAISVIVLAILAGAMILGTFGMLWQARAKGTVQGFETALKKTYEMGRPIPDGQYLCGPFRIEASHAVAGGRTVEVQVKVMENRTGLPLARASASVEAY